MAGGKEEYNAFFYSLVSTDTQVSLTGLLISSLFPPFLLETPACIYVMTDLKIILVYQDDILFADAGDVLLNKKAAVSY
jgi:hypothetical protein